MRSAARLLIAGVALGVFAAGAPLALAGYPGRNGDIAVLWNQFDRGGDDDRELRRVSRSGQVLNRFAPCSRPETDVPTGLCPRDPAYSAIGSRIAFELEGRLGETFGELAPSVAAVLDEPLADELTRGQALR